MPNKSTQLGLFKDGNHRHGFVTVAGAVRTPRSVLGDSSRVAHTNLSVSATSLKHPNSGGAWFNQSSGDPTTTGGFNEFGEVTVLMSLGINTQAEEKV